MMLKQVLFKLVPFLLSIFFNAVLAQDKPLGVVQTKFEHITNSQGLLHNSIGYIYQDSKGYIWIGTYNGLYKYDGYKFTFYNNELGNDKSLIGNTVHCIFEDSKGVLWIGTRKGLCFYDRNTNTFRRNLYDVGNKSPLTLNMSIHDIKEDKVGALWVATSNGLLKLDRERLNYRYRLKQYNVYNSEKKISNNLVTHIFVDKENSIWVGTRKGLNRIRYVSKNQIAIDKEFTSPIDQAHILSLLVNNENDVLVGTRHGLYKLTFDSKGNAVSHSFPESKEWNNNLGGNITSLHQRQDGILWVGTSNGLIEFDSQSNQLKKYVHSKNDKHSLRSNNISCLYEDRSGILWIGTTRGGVSKLDFQKKQIAHYNKKEFPHSYSLSGDIINTIYEDSKKNIWVGTFGNGLNKFSPAQSAQGFVSYTTLKDQNGSIINCTNIHAICEDNYGNLWLGSMSDGLIQARQTEEGLECVRYMRQESPEGNLNLGKITLIHKDKKGDLWMGGAGYLGLLRFTPSKEFGTLPKIHSYRKKEHDPQSISSNNISTIYEDSEGVLWLGTFDSGAVKIYRDDQNNPIEYVRIKGNDNNPRGLNNNCVFSIHEDGKKNIWLGTFGGGLNMVSASERNQVSPKIVHFKKEQGLSSNEIYGILEDDHQNLWISTNNGISSYHMKDSLFTNLHMNDGLQALNFRKNAYLRGGDGQMYFGGINGINVFYPDGFQNNTFVPEVEIVGFKVFNKEVAVNEKVLGKVILKKDISQTKSITLENSHNSFSFEFAGLHYASPNQNKYKYKLEGFDEDWVTTDHKRRFASYANLDAGDYVFKVKASNNDNIWNNHPERIRIKVLPPLWKTWWAYLTYLLFAFFLMWLFRKYILINEQYRNRIQIEKIEREKIKEINKMKLEFFTNISHEFKTPLTLILGPLQNLLKVKTVEPNVKESLLLMKRNAEHLFRLINQVMEFRKVENKELKLNISKGDLVDFCRKVVFAFKVLADKKQIQLSFESAEFNLIAHFDWDKMEKILNNLLSNSIKYTPNGGKVKVSLSLSQNKRTANQLKSKRIKIIVEDTGIGIPKNQLAMVFNRFYQIEDSNRTSSMGSGVGLALTKALIELHQGKIKVTSHEGDGSKFTIKLPLVEERSGYEEIIAPLTEETYPIAIEKEPLPKDTNETEEIKKEEVTAVPANDESSDKSPLLLLVEDNPDMQQFIKSSLLENYEIILANDGQKGLNKALDKVPDIIISDVMMPNMDGIQLCSELKKNEITDHIPIILLTARSSVDHRMEGIEVGADAYIPKPFDMRLLQMRVKKLLEQRQLLRKKFASRVLTLDSQKIGLNNTEKAFLTRAEKVIEDNLTNSEFGVDDLAHELFFSRMQLYRKLKSIRGLSGNEFIRSYRLKKAALLLRETDLNISEVLYETGFTNRSYFSKCFKQEFGTPPKEYTKKHKETAQEN